jgi:hypothetical protein
LTGYTDAVQAAAPASAHRLIPSRFSQIGLFDTVTTAADLEPVTDLFGVTNDRFRCARKFGASTYFDC